MLQNFPDKDQETIFKNVIYVNGEVTEIYGIF